MQKYIVINSHSAEECEPMEVAMSHLPAHLEGQDFLCTCPEGPHGFYMVLEGDTAETVIAGLPPEWRRGTEAYPVEIFQLARRAPEA
ncbi:MAG: hypothetical protein M3285_05130 [Actinomycetota bacterium]|nr:hypothetical protein [Actinomycetota bacterium]